MLSGKLSSNEKGAAVFNRAARIFLLKTVILIIAWKSLYYFVLEPSRIPDKFLTDFITSAVTTGINLIWHPSPEAIWAHGTILSEVTMSHITINNKRVFSIADACNGLDLMAIYIGMILLLPYPVKRKLVFSIGGLIVIIIANIIRCLSLYWIYGYDKSLFELNHKYIFSLFMYMVIFCGWILFTKKPKGNEAAVS